ncbi:MAG: cation transporter, partial [Microthrixaceae bacterium]|nr:cation transporter [Microthrixaceae bacterium]
MDEVEPGPARDVAGPDALAASERTARRYRTRLAIALVSSSIFLLVEAGAGRLTNSLTLLSGAGHLLADVVAMGMGLAAFGLADRQRRLRRTDRRAGTRTFTPYQVQMVAALLGSLATIGIAVFAIILAFGRRSGDAEVLGLPMLVVAAIGLLVNLASFVLLREGERVSLRLGGSWLEVLADTTDTLGVTAAALLVELFNWAWADALIGFALAIWLLPRSFRLARQSLRILRRAAPSDLDLDE